MRREANPYAAPAVDTGTGDTNPNGPSLLARLWVLGLGVNTALGGLFALVLRTLAWEREGTTFGTVTAVVGAHFRLMVFVVLTGATMTSATLAAARLRPPSLAGPGALGIGAWAVWCGASLVIGLFARLVGTASIYVHWALALALAMTALSTGWVCARPQREATSRERWLAGLLATACGAFAVAYALFILNLVPFTRLLTTFETIAVIAAVIVVVLTRRSQDGTRVGQIYRFAGVVPAAILWLGIGAVLGTIGQDIQLWETLVSTSHAHAAGSAALCGVLALSHSSFDLLKSQAFRERPARAAGVFLCVSLLATTVMMYWLGALGMPMRYPTYLELLIPYQRGLTIAGFGTAAAFAAVIVVALLPGKPRTRGSV